jgi:hypothetical protein
MNVKETYYAVVGETDYVKLVPITWTVLRLMGVYFVVVGASAVIEDIGTAVSTWRLYVAEHHTGTLLDFFSMRLFADAAYTAAGLYLVFGGRWLIENVFLPAKADEASDGDDGVETNTDE